METGFISDWNELYMADIGRYLELRSGLEISNAYLCSLRHLMNSEVATNPKTVMLLPGFTCGHSAMHLMKMILKARSHNVYDWGLGINMGSCDIRMNFLKNRVIELSEENNQAITLIGVSLGGIFSKYLSHILPLRIERIITLGSPFYADHSEIKADGLFEMINGNIDTNSHFYEINETVKRSPKVRTVSVYTKEDGIVPWEACIEKGNDNIYNIEVSGSHFALGHNQQAMHHIIKELDS